MGRSLCVLMVNAFFKTGKCWNLVVVIDSQPRRGCYVSHSISRAYHIRINSQGSSEIENFKASYIILFYLIILTETVSFRDEGDNYYGNS